MKAEKAALRRSLCPAAPDPATDEPADELILERLWSLPEYRAAAIMTDI